MVYKKIRMVKISIAILFILSILMPAGFSNQILGIDITISQNPIPCGGSATVTATIKRAPLSRGDLPLGGIAKLWDYDTWFRDGDDLLDQSTVTLWSEQNTVSFTLRCDSKDGGCDLFGPSGESGECGTNIYVSFYGHKSARIYVKCEQMDVYGEMAILATDDDVVVGDETSATVLADRPIEGVTNAQFDVSYDSSVFEVLGVEIIHPELFIKSTEGFFSYDITNPDFITFTLTENIMPINLVGPLVKINLLAKLGSPTIWDTTNIRLKEDSAFFDELDQQINVCLGGNCSVFIAPDDVTPPIINEGLISFSQGKIVGLSGSVTDDFDNYENYLSVSLYNETDVLVAEDFVNQDGSFQLENFFWLDDEIPSRLVASNGVNISTTYFFIPSTVSIPYVLQNYNTYIKNNSGEPGETISIDFDISSKSDIPETYGFTISDKKGWDIEQSTFLMVLEPMESKTITINVTIPTTAENRTTNEITLEMASQNYLENIDSDSVVLSVYGTYEAPAPSEKTPGFELIFTIIIIVIFAIFLRRKR